MSEHLRIAFRYTKSQCVQYEGRHWRVTWRRYTERDVLGPVITYLLDLETSPEEHAQSAWADEADLADVPDMAAWEAP